jgi:DNA-binding MarR family transcriptional regulator
MSSEEPSERYVDARGLREAFHSLIRRFGLLDTTRTPCGQPIAVTHAHALMEILHDPGMRQGDLASTLGLSKSAVSRMVVELERRGWIKRHTDTDDGRIRRLKLTAWGRRLAQRVDEASVERFSAMLEGIPPATRAQAVSMLKVLQRAIPSSHRDEGEHGTTP